MREFDHKFLCPQERRPLGAGKVSQPVHKVKGYISGAHATGLEEPLELGEKYARRSLYR